MLRKKINTERLAQGLSFYQLAKDAELQRTQLMRYLRGETDLFGENIESLLKVLNLDVCNIDETFTMSKTDFILENNYLRAECPCCGGTVIYDEGCENCKSCFVFIAP